MAETDRGGLVEQPYNLGVFRQRSGVNPTCPTRSTSAFWNAIRKLRQNLKLESDGRTSFIWCMMDGRLYQFSGQVFVFMERLDEPWPHLVLRRLFSQCFSYMWRSALTGRRCRRTHLRDNVGGSSTQSRKGT